MTDIQLKKALFKLPDGTYISPYTDCKGALEVGDIGQALYVDETQGLRRRLNGQTVAINKNTQEFLNRLKAIRTSYPSLFCEEWEWQDISNQNFLKQCGKFVICEDGKPIQAVDNYIKVGSVRVINGIASEFFRNNGSAIKIPVTVPLSTATQLSIKLKVYIEQTGSYSQCIILGAADNILTVRTDGGNRIKFWGSTNGGTSWTTSGADTGIDIVSGWQILELTYDGTNYQMHRTVNGTTVDGALIASAPVSDKPEMQFGGCGNVFELRGKIDLKESSITINNKTFWTWKTFSEGSTTPYIRLPKVVCMQGALDLSKLGELDNQSTRRLVAQKRPNNYDKYWYNWYSDGWLEQGNNFEQLNTTRDWTVYAITLKIPYKDISYYIGVHSGYGDNSTSEPCIGGSKTPNSFRTRPYNNTGNANWHTCGWGNIPTAADCNIEEFTGNNVQYPYFIQIAQGQHTMKTIRNDWEISNPYTIFDAKQSQYPLNNASWLKSLGQWNEKAVYTYAYEALLVELNNSIETNTTVDLPSGGKYTKHLQTVNFDVNKVIKVKSPVIEEGILTPTDTDYVQLKIGGNVLNTAKSWQLDLLCQISSNYIIATDYSSDYIPFAINKNTLIINNSLNTFSTIAEGWKHIRVKYSDSTGYEVYTSDDGTAFDLVTSVEKVDKIDYAGNNLNLKGTPVDLHTVQFKYDLGNGVEHLVTTGVEYKSVVWNKTEHTTSEADYAYNFIVDVVNESFRLPLYDKVFNNPYADLYYFIGDTLQNTSLIDLGRISESVTVNKSEIEKLRILIGQIAGDIPTVETSKYGVKNVTLYNGVDLGNHVIDLSSYIPLDGHQYDVYGYIYWAVGDTSGNDRNAYIYDASGANKLYQLSVDGVVSPNAGNCTDTWQVPLPVNSRTITLRLTGTSDSKFSKFQLVLLWFRKY